MKKKYDPNALVTGMFPTLKQIKDRKKAKAAKKARRKK